MEQATRLRQPRLGDYLERAWRESALWAVVIISLYLVLALATYSPDDPGWSFVGAEGAVNNTAGRLGAWFADLAFFLVGVFAYLIPVALAASAFLVFRDRGPEPETKLYWLVLRWIGLLLTLGAGAGLTSLQLAGPFGDLPNGIGGALGQLISETASAGFGLGGGSLVLLGFLLTGLSLFTGLSPLLIVDGVGDLTLMMLRFPLRLYQRINAERAERRQPPHRGDWDRDWTADWDDEVDDEVESTSAPTLRTDRKAEREATPNDWTDPSNEAVDVPQNAIRTLISPPHANPLLGAEQSLEIGIGAGFEAVTVPTRREADTGDQPTASELAFAPRTQQPAPAAFAPTPEPEPALILETEIEPMPQPAPQPAPEREPELALTPEPALEPALKREPACPAEQDPQAVEQEPQAAARAVPRVTTLDPPPTAVEPVWAEASAPSTTPAAPSAHPLPSHTASMSMRGDFSERPPLDLLDPPRRSGNAATPEQLETMSRELEARLAEFGVIAEVVEVHPGPVVALFELDLAPGVKVSKITGLSKDIARALSKISVRVVEVIPGKSVIGLEVPNEQREMVTLSEIIGSRVYQEAKSPLTISMGTNISGEPVVADLGRMPHALIAGTTGSGKSVAINAMILSLVYKAGPDDVRLIMVDPKMLELSVYEGIPHLLTPVVTDMKEAANALRWCVGEMERRYKLMAALGVRNIAGYNRKVLDAIAAGEPIADPTYAPIVNAAIAEGLEPPEVPTLEKLPNIVVIIDELADMMMVVGKKVEELIARLAQKARASGIHLLLATQRPSVDVLTGLIKANIPTRMAFKVSARVDSRTVLDQMGAEHLLGHGDMLYLPPGGSISQRVHGAFVDDHEVHKVVHFLKQQGAPDYIDNILQEPSEHLPGIDPEPKGGGDVEDQDPLFDEAVQIVIESRRASISGVQRRLKIGYNRAARMIEEMERIGVVGPAESNGNREVLSPPPQD